MKQAKIKKVAFAATIVVSVAVLVGLFQNCAGQGQFKAAGIADSDGGGINSVNLGSLTPAGSMSSMAAEPNQSYNFASGDKPTCDSQVQQIFGFVGACSVGGACDGSNPTLYGACVKTDASGNGTLQASSGAPPLPQPMSPPPPSTSQTYNFVAGDKAACETSIQQKFNLAGICSMGAGCDGKNPGLWGACIMTDSSGVPLPNQAAFMVTAPAPMSPPPPSTSQTYNFVAGDKASCESSAYQRLGRDVPCTIGGGCDGKNPGLWGACVSVAGSTPVMQTTVFAPPLVGYVLNPRTGMVEYAPNSAWVGYDQNLGNKFCGFKSPGSRVDMSQSTSIAADVNICNVDVISDGISIFCEQGISGSRYNGAVFDKIVCVK